MPSDNHVRVTRFGFVNAYLVREDDGLTVVDALFGGAAAKTILAAAQNMNAPIKRLVLTHGHADHVGSVDSLAKAIPGLEVLITERDALVMAGDRSAQPGETPKKVKGSISAQKTKPTGSLIDGQMVGSLQVIATPGHTPGHVAFLDTRDQTVFCGDVYTTFGHVETTAKMSWPFPLAVPPAWDKAMIVASAAKLAELEPARLAPGHGRVIEDPVAQMRRAVARAG
jgi:glyoxylase-like metal-dependent hydrolase (beta-lactamase superfamily II)